MNKYLKDRASARRALADQLLEIDRLTDEEIDREKHKDASAALTILRLSKLSEVERVFSDEV